jgi:hypothetical protein
MTVPGTDAASGLVWRRVHWPRPLEIERALGILRLWAADQRSPRIVLETRASQGEVRYLIGAAPASLATLTSSLDRVTASLTTDVVRSRVSAAVKLKASTRHRAIRTDHPEAAAFSILNAITRVEADEELVLQLVLGPRRIPLAIPTHSPSSVVMPWYQVAWRGNGGQIDSEKRSALRDKVSDHGFACTIRLGVRAGSSRRRTELLLGSLAALRTVEAPGVKLRLVRDAAQHLDRAAAPFFWPLRLNVGEVLAATAWPLGDDDLPGQPAAHPKRLPPPKGTTGKGRVVAASTAPGVSADLTLSAKNASHHTWILGPTGTGKSTLLQSLITQDIADGRAVVLIEPKGDLVSDVLARMPEHRTHDVVVLDATDPAAVVGLNPLSTRGRRPEVVADQLLMVFRQLYGDAIGPRSADILYSSLATLVRRPDASLVMLPLLLTNAGFRRSITSKVTDPIALSPFWQWYEGLSEAERQTAIAPVMNKLRPLLRPGIRAVLGQQKPQFDIRQVFTERKILLVPLQRGVLGPEAAALLGSLVVSELWQATQGRAAIAAAKRHPVMIYIDEVQDYLNLGTDIGEAFAQARGLNVAFHAAHQFIRQLPESTRTALQNNARSRVVFQTSHADALELAKGHPELTPEDFTSLGQYEVYASLFAGGQVSPYASGRTYAPTPETIDPDAMRRLSRDRYGQSIKDIEAGFEALLHPEHASAAGPQAPHGRSPRRPS